MSYTPSRALPTPTFIGRAATFRTPGRAGTAGQKIFAIHNATASDRIVRIKQIGVDMAGTAAKVVIPPVIRMQRFTAIPTNGSSCPKVAMDSAQSSSASVTCWQDASADNTGSGTTLTITLPASNIMSQEWAARALTLVGAEQFDRTTFFDSTGNYPVLRALEGMAVFLDYTVATHNPATDFWIVTCEWEEALT